MDFWVVNALAQIVALLVVAAFLLLYIANRLYFKKGKK